MCAKGAPTIRLTGSVLDVVSDSTRDGRSHAEVWIDAAGSEFLLHAYGPLAQEACDLPCGSAVQILATVKSKRTKPYSGREFGRVSFTASEIRRV